MDSGYSIQDLLEAVLLVWGKYNVMLTVYINHPRRTYQVDHVQSTSLIFFSDNTFLWLAESLES